jgi:hypothetical protein
VLCDTPRFGKRLVGLNSSLFSVSLSIRRRHSRLAGAKRYCNAWLQDHVHAMPGLIVSQRPAMPGADGVLGEQDIARM